MNKKETYFTPEYGRLYEEIEGGVLQTFSFAVSEGEVYYQYLKRPIPYLVDGKQYYDAMTPYGYGGPLVVRVEKGQEEDLVQKFREALDEKFSKEGIICEFVRFHPMEKNAEFFQVIYHLRNKRTAVYTDLSADDPITTEFHSETIKCIRKAKRKGVITKIQQEPDWKDMELFVNCYYENMRAIGASEYYFFSIEYFRKMWETLKERLILVLAYCEEKLVGADLGFADLPVYTCHLTSATNEGRKLNVARVIVGDQALWAKANGYGYLFQGCGVTASEEDSLLKFKKFFTKGCLYTFWQGDRISNLEIYRKVCEISGKYDDTTYFPAYRNNGYVQYVESQEKRQA